MRKGTREGGREGGDVGQRHKIDEYSKQTKYSEAMKFFVTKRLKGKD